MDFDAILYIILIVGSILLSVVKTFKKDETERHVKKMRSQPVEAETYEEGEVRPKKKAKVSSQRGNDNEYFSYETMSDRDFEQKFAQNAEESKEHFVKETENPKVGLTLNEEDVYKGVVWSEILKRKY